MQRNHRKISVANIVILLLVLLNAIVLQQGLVSHPGWYYLLYVTVPLLMVCILARRKV
jgi:hypothetical protein